MLRRELNQTLCIRPIVTSHEMTVSPNVNLRLSCSPTTSDALSPPHRLIGFFACAYSIARVLKFDNSEHKINMKVTSIIIDMGHNCPPDTGARGNGLQEDVVVKEVGERVIAKLERDGVRVIRVNPRSAGSVNESLSKRVSLANASEGGLYVSIHANSADSANARGSEVYYFGGNETGEELATIMSSAVAKSINTTNRGAKDGSQFFVLRRTNMTAILIELGFLSNKGEAEKLKDSYDELAAAIAKTLLDWNCTTYESLTEFQPKNVAALANFVAREHEHADQTIVYAEE